MRPGITSPKKKEDSLWDQSGKTSDPAKKQNGAKKAEAESDKTQATSLTKGV